MSIYHIIPLEGQVELGNGEKSLYAFYPFVTMPLVVFKWKRYAMQKSRKFDVDQRGKRQTVLPLAGLLLVYSTKAVGLWIFLIQIKSPLGKGHILIAQKGLWGVKSIFPRATL